MPLDENTTKILLAVLAVITATALVTLTIRIVRKKNSDNKTTINQNKNRVTHGDIVGRDKKTKY